MKQMGIFTLTAAMFFSCAATYAGFSEDFADYDAGKSMKWFHFFRKESVKDGKAAEIENKILSVLKRDKVSDEAFRLSCVILKPIATGETVEVLAPFLCDANRVVAACDVIVSVEDSSADDALKNAFFGTNGFCASTIVGAIGRRGRDFSLLCRMANSDDVSVACAATLSLGSFPDSSDAVSELLKIADKDDVRRKNAYIALCAQAWKCLQEGDVSTGNKALSKVPFDFSMSVVSRGMLSENSSEFFDKLIVDDASPVSKMAGRAISGARLFDNSAEICARFASFSPRAKTILIGTFIPSGDCRFWKTVSPELDAADAALRLEAVYASRFLCEDEKDIAKIYSMLSSQNRPLAMSARAAIVENPSYVVDKFLRSQKGSLVALELLSQRCDKCAQAEIEKLFVENQGYKNPKISAAMGRCVGFENVEKFAVLMKTTKDSELKKAVSRIVVKTLMAAKGSGDAFMKKAFASTIAANLSPDDELYIKAKERFFPSPKSKSGGVKKSSKNVSKK